MKINDKIRFPLLGFLSRVFASTASHLVSATIVTSSGEVVEASEDHNPDLLWGMRGAGANFGVAVKLVFRLDVVAPKVFAGDVVMFGKGTAPNPMMESDKTRFDIVLNFFEYFQNAPDECAALMVLAPKGPVISRLVHVPKDPTMPPTQIEAEAKKAFEPLTSFGKALANETKMMDYWSDVQKLGEFGPSHYYTKAVITPDIPSDQLHDVVQKMCACAETIPVVNMASGIIITPLGGELSRLGK